jgi:hypothetical protein
MTAGPPARKSSPLLLGTAFAAGMLSWIVLARLGHRSEAWDAPLYFQLGIPVLALLSALLGYLEPMRAWRFGLAPYAGQGLVMFALNPGGNLPLGLITLGILSLPGIAAATLGAWLSKRR